VLFATEKLLVNADNDIRKQVENAVQQAGYAVRMKTRPRLHIALRKSAASDLIIMMA
jgi:Cd2+/Zn2+-exporting ATPase